MKLKGIAGLMRICESFTSMPSRIRAAKSRRNAVATVAAVVSPAATADCAGRVLATVQHAARELPLPRLEEACAGLRRAAASGL